MSLITIIGRGHSGTRAISHTLYGSGVFMGRTINASGDMVPPGDMYDACRVFAKQVRWLGDLNWDFSAAHEAEIDPEFTELIKRYLEPVLARRGLHLATWTRRAFDTVERDPRKVSDRLLRRLAAGDVLLLHDGNSAHTPGPKPRPVVLEALPRILDELAAQDLSSAPLPDR